MLGFLRSVRDRAIVNVDAQTLARLHVGGRGYGSGLMRAIRAALPLLGPDRPTGISRAVTALADIGGRGYGSGEGGRYLKGVRVALILVPPDTA
jgi:hypothetical protein